MHTTRLGVQAAYRTQPSATDDAFVANARSFLDAALFAPRAIAGAALTLSSSTADEPVRRTPQTMQELAEAAVMYAERGMQAEYEAFSAITALVPPEVADAIPPQLRQLAPRPQAQNDVIDVEPLVTSTQPSATLAAANSPETLLANQLAAEVATLRDAVKTVREAAEALQLAADEAQQPMLRLNLREARAILARRLEQLSAQCSGGVGAEAASEATMLLVAVDTVLDTL